MNWLNKIKRWPMRKKRIFALFLAIFLTILIIVFNSAMNILWKDKTKNSNNPVSSFKSAFSEIFNGANPILDKAFSSTTQAELSDQLDKLSASLSSTSVDQINSTSSSSSTTSNVVK
jgi:predicted PurR-regulated permease PerM